MPLESLRPRDIAPEYRSPYGVRLQTPEAQRLAGLDAFPWNDASAQAVLAASDWYSPETEQRYGSWGPRARRYPAPTVTMDAATARERVVAVAAR